MNEAAVKARWRELRGDARARWPRLTEDDVAAIDGDRVWLGTALRTRYGWSEARVRFEIERLLAPAGTVHAINGEAGLSDAARTAFAPGLHKVREGLDDLGQGARAFVGDIGERARDRASEAGARAGAAADAARERVREGAQQVGDRAGDWLAKAEGFVRERPLAAIGIAFAAGWLLFRRR